MSRLAVAAVLALTAAAAAVTAAPAAAAADRQSLVELLDDHVAWARPSQAARPVAVVTERRPLTGVRTVLPVLRRTVRGGRPWANVMLPGRPNGRRGWIREARTLSTSTGLRITVDLSERRVTVRELGTVVRRFRAVVGAPRTPTPRGRFFVEEGVKLSASAHGGPFALATSARSAVLQEFEGGPGQIALHGVNHLDSPFGTAASHGCVRLSTRSITWLARRVGAGVPLTVRA